MVEYRVIDKSGGVVRTGQQIVKDDGMGNAVVVYEELCDLPVGEYVIEPGTINLEIRPQP